MFGLEILLTTLLPALLPVATDGIKSGFNKLFGNEVAAAPKSFEDALRWEDKAIERLKTMAEIDKPVGNPSQWVVDLRASMRYLGVALLLVGHLVLSVIDAFHSIQPTSLALSGQLASSAFFFLFGDRVYLGLKGAKK
jgi:hypothetical protein